MPAAARRRNNGSAFFSRLPLRAKSAMAEILVSDLCDLSPAAAHRRIFRCCEERGRLLLDRFRLFFSPVLSCFGSIVFSLAITMAYIVFSQISPL
jgi:hypothetical protein